MEGCPTEEEGGSYLKHLPVLLLLRTFVRGQMRALKLPLVAVVHYVAETDPSEFVSLSLS